MFFFSGCHTYCRCSLVGGGPYAHRWPSPLTRLAGRQETLHMFWETRHPPQSPWKRRSLGRVAARSRVSLAAGPLLRRRPLGLDLDLRDAFLRQANLLRGSLREVELPARHIRPTVINRHRDRLAGFEIGYGGLRPQGQRPMRCSQRVLIERLAARRLLAVEARSVPGGRTNLGGFWCPCGSGSLFRWGSRHGCGLLGGLGARGKRYGRLEQATSCEAPQPQGTDESIPGYLLVHEQHSCCHHPRLSRDVDALWASRKDQRHGATAASGATESTRQQGRAGAPSPASACIRCVQEASHRNRRNPEDSCSPRPVQRPHVLHAD
jgi:hypothetical protein